MERADRPRFLEIVNALAANFGRETDEALLTAYWLGLNDLPVELFEIAAGRALREERYFPTVAALRDRAGLLRIDDQVAAAWDTLIGAIGKVGAYASPDFEDKAINATVRSLGGWERLTGQSSEELHKWTRKDFEKTYRAWAAREMSGDAGQRLIGLHEQSNAPQGYLENVPPPVEIPAPYLSDEQKKLPNRDPFHLLETRE